MQRSQRAQERAEEAAALLTKAQQIAAQTTQAPAYGESPAQFQTRSAEFGKAVAEAGLLKPYTDLNDKRKQEVAAEIQLAQQCAAALKSIKGK
jgi:hypothetical protein